MPLRKILALSEIHVFDPVARAIEDACTLQTFSSEYMANILEQRQQVLPEPSALPLTRRHNLLDLAVVEPELVIYNRSSADLS